MKLVIRRTLVALALLAGTSCLAATPAPAARTGELPGNSVLRLTDRFVDQDGRSFTLAQRRGRPQLVAMFYSSCKYACPLLIDSGKGVDHALSAAERAKLRVLYVSLDPARDQPKVLAALAVQRKLDRTRWTLATSDAAGVRRTAAVLGVRYRQLANGEFNHSSMLVLLDAEGRIVARTEKLGPIADPEFLKQVRATLAKKA
jgi:protein SCO1/2